MRPTHSPKPKREHYWRTRKDPFESEWPKLLVWLEAEPDATAKELFARLREEHQDKFTDGQLRTLQRRVKEWRCLTARRLVFADNQDLSGVPAPAAAPAADTSTQQLLKIEVSE